MHSFYARVEHKLVVGVDVVNFLATTSLILFRWHRGMTLVGKGAFTPVHKGL